MAGDWEKAATTKTGGSAQRPMEGTLPPEQVTAIRWRRSGEPGVRVCDQCGERYSRSDVRGEGEHFVMWHVYRNGEGRECRWPRLLAWTMKEAQA
jgi:hypothetical protein